MYMLSFQVLATKRFLHLDSFFVVSFELFVGMSLKPYYFVFSAS